VNRLFFELTEKAFLPGTRSILPKEPLKPGYPRTSFPVPVSHCRSPPSPSKERNKRPSAEKQRSIGYDLKPENFPFSLQEGKSPSFTLPSMGPVRSSVPSEEIAIAVSRFECFRSRL